MLSLLTALRPHRTCLEHRDLPEGDVSWFALVGENLALLATQTLHLV